MFRHRKREVAVFYHFAHKILLIYKFFSVLRSPRSLFYKNVRPDRITANSMYGIVIIAINQTFV
jgi:hypothetical protein